MAHHHHAHDHHHSHHHASASFNRAFAIAIMMTLCYTLAEMAYGIHANAMSLLADAIHNLGDSLGLLLAWLANWLTTLPSKQRYSYGYKRTTVLAALGNAFILVATSALIAYESILKLLTPSSVNENIIIIVGFIGIIVNASASLLFMRGAKDDINIKGAFLHLLADALILAGVVVSAIIIRYTGFEWIDPIISLLIVFIVLVGTFGLLRDAVNLMLDAVPHGIDYIGAKKYLENYPGVTAVHDLHIWGLSTREVALTAHLVMPNTPLTDDDYANINHELQHDFHIHHITLQVESGKNYNPCGRKIQC